MSTDALDLQTLDAWLGIADRWTGTATAVVLALGIIGGLGNLALRRRSTTPAGA